MGWALGQFAFAGRYKRNAKSLKYMETLIQSQNPSMVLDAKDLKRDPLKKADEIFLFWPDAIGYGWFLTELQVFLKRSPGVRVTVHNGRRRTFTLSINTWVSILLRRIMERFWLGEAAYVLFFILASPILVTWDFLGGHR